MKPLIFTLLLIFLSGCDVGVSSSLPVKLHIVYAGCTLPYPENTPPEKMYGFCKACWLPELYGTIEWGRPLDRRPIDGKVSPWGHVTEFVNISELQDGDGFPVPLYTPTPNKYFIREIYIDFGIDEEGRRWDNSFIVVEERS